MNNLEKTIIDLYLEENSLRDVAKIIGKGHTFIREILIKNNIKRRGRIEGITLSKKNDIPLNNYIKKVIEGELLGDGHVSLGRHQSCFSYGTSKEEYAKFLSNLLSKNNLISVGNGVYMSNTLDKRNNTYYKKYHFSTISTIQLKEIRNKWYENRIKIVPNNLILTKESVLHWWIGDGSNNINRHYGWFETDAFIQDEVKFLSMQLNNLIDIKSKVNSCKIENNKIVYRIYIPRISLEKMLDFIGPCPVNCYNYKWSKKEAI